MEPILKGDFDELIKRIVIRVAVWRKGRVIPNFNPSVWRWDSIGNPIRFLDYGKRDSIHGWEIDHIVPVSRGGPDTLSNMQPLHWKLNVEKSNKIVRLTRRVVK